MSESTIIFQPSGRRGPVKTGATLLEAARHLGVDIESTCGGAGTCGKCRVRVESGPDSVTPLTDTERQRLGPELVAQGLRLACQTRIAADAKIFVPEESRRAAQVVRKEAGDRTVALDPAVRSLHISVTPPTLEDAAADSERALAALEDRHGLRGLSFDLGLLQRLPALVRKAGWDLTVCVWNSRTIIDVRAGDDARPILGLALDIGTTTLAAYLVDLQTGEVVATGSAVNPQVTYGDDLIARLHHVARHPEAASDLQQVVIAEIDGLAARATEQMGASPADIIDVTVAANTAMHHLFLGLDTHHLRMAPFVPAVHAGLDLKASDLGLTFHPGCRLHALPIVAGFVGSDSVAAAIVEEPYEQDEVVLIIDIGTNGELVLGNRQRLLSTSCATGPAFEGSHIEFGMRAAAGAIERVRIDPSTLEVRFKVIGTERWSTDEPPGEIGAKGICGSGIVEAAAEMFAAGIILPTGNLNPDIRHERLLFEDGRPHRFVIATAEETSLGRDITVSLKDIRALQLAKAALRAGADILARAYGVEKPDRVVLAGAFGTYIDKEHALAIGMLPDCDLDRVSSVGNAAGDGARFALLSLKKRAEARRMADDTEFVELATDPDFQRLYVQAMAFQKTPPRPTLERQIITDGEWSSRKKRSDPTLSV